MMDSTKKKKNGNHILSEYWPQNMLNFTNIPFSINFTHIIQFGS